MPNKLTVLFVYVLGVAPMFRAIGQEGTLLLPNTYSFKPVTPPHQWEIGTHLGVPLVFGDLGPRMGHGGGFHIRKALDYVFSLRGELLLANMMNENPHDGKTRTTWQSGTFDLIASLNNLVWTDTKAKRANFYGAISIGLNRFKVDVLDANSLDIKAKPFSIQSHGGGGAGFSVRLNERVNLTLESKVYVMFGKEEDRLDGVARQEGDVVSYSNIRFNYNFGNNTERTEPLYWINPMIAIQEGITELKRRPIYDMTDSDGDGVIDQLDQDNHTPPHVQVDTRGLPLDSDGDGIPNHEDIEPFIPSTTDGVLIGEEYVTSPDVEKIVNEQLKKYDETGQVPMPGASGKGGKDDLYQLPKRKKQDATVNWFLPIIHFDIDSYEIRETDYGILAGIGQLLKNNPDLRLVVTGCADKTASNNFNDLLSYKRAEAAILHLVERHGVERQRLLLHFSGEDAPLVPSSKSNLMNRRVEFRVAEEGDEEMMPPVIELEKKKN